MKVIDYSEDPPIDSGETKGIVSQLSKATEDSGTLWPCLTEYLEKQKEISFKAEEKHEVAEVNQLYLLNELIDLAIAGEFIKNELDTSAEEIRLATFQAVKDKAARKHDYEKTKQVMQKRRPPTTSKAEWSTWQSQWNSAAEKYRSRIKQYDVELWKLQRAKSLRTAPIGRDTADNLYWLFGQRQKDDSREDLGVRLIVEVGSTRCHPICTAERSDDCLGCTGEVCDTRSSSRDKRWFEINTADSAQQLCKWIMYRANVTLSPKPKVLDGRSKDGTEASRVATPDGDTRSKANGSDSAGGSECGDTSTNSLIVLPNLAVNLDNGSTSIRPTADGSNPTPRSEVDQALLETWLQVETLVKRIEEFARYLESCGIR